MRVPGLVAAHVHLHQAHPALDKSACQQAGGTEEIATVERTDRVGLGREVKRLANPAGGQQGNGTVTIPVEIGDRSEPVEMTLLTFDDSQQAGTVVKPPLRHTFGQRQVRWLKLGAAHVLHRPPLMIKAVRTGTKHPALRGRIDDPGIVTFAHHATKLAGNDPSTGVGDHVGNHRGSGQLAAVPQQVTDLRDDRRVIGGLGLVARKASRGVAPPGQHDVVTQRVAIGRMRQGTDHRPLVTAVGQPRQVLADLQTGSPSRNRIELTADVVRSVGLHVEAVVLSQAPGEEQVDHRLDRSPTVLITSRLDIGLRQAHQPDRTRLQPLPPREMGM